LFTKSLAAGIPAVAVLAAGFELGAVTAVADGLGLLFLLVTTALLVADLKRPSRFWFLLTRPNMSSWIAKGGIVLMGYGVLLVVHLVASFFPLSTGLQIAGGTALCVGAGLAAAYTAWLFRQARGRPYWMRRGLEFQLLAQAAVAGAAALVLIGGNSFTAAWLPPALAVYGGLLLLEPWLSPKGREDEYHRASALVTRGPYAGLHWWLGIGGGVVVPMVLAWVFPGGPILAGCAVLALVGLWVEEDLFVRAGQALPIS